MSDEQTEIYDDVSFGWLATMYPHETHATYPERFWAYFQTQCPGVSREEMERLLREDANGADIVGVQRHERIVP